MKLIHPETLDGMATMIPKAPIDYLRFQMEVRKLTVAQLAKELEVHRQNLYNITGKDPRPISSKLAMKLAKYFGRPVEFWLGGETPLLTDVIDSRNDGAARAEGTNAPPPVESGLLVDRELIAHLSTPGGELEISAFDETRVSPASYDLSAGLFISEGYDKLGEADWSLACRSLHDRSRLSRAEREKIQIMLDDYELDIRYSTSIVLQPAQSVLIVSREEVRFGGNYMAFIGGTGRNARRRLLVNHGLKVDPGYQGHLIVSAMNIGPKAISLKAGDELLTLAIKRLPRRPDHSYRHDRRNRILRVAERIGRALEDLFEIKQQPDGTKYKVSFLGPVEKIFFRGDDDDVIDRAIAWILATLESDSRERPIVEEAVGRVLDYVPIAGDELEAIARLLKLSKDRTMAIKSKFADNPENGFRDAIGWLGTNLFAATIAVMAEAGRPAESV